MPRISTCRDESGAARRRRWRPPSPRARRRRQIAGACEPPVEQARTGRRSSVGLGQPDRLQLGPEGGEVGRRAHDTLKLRIADTASSPTTPSTTARPDGDRVAHGGAAIGPAQDAVQADAAVQEGEHDERAVEEPPRAVVPAVDVEGHAEVAGVVEHPRRQHVDRQQDQQEPRRQLQEVPPPAPDLRRRPPRRTCRRSRRRPCRSPCRSPGRSSGRLRHPRPEDHREARHRHRPGHEQHPRSPAQIVLPRPRDGLGQEATEPVAGCGTRWPTPPRRRPPGHRGCPWRHPSG